jgi:hypothetical protein
MPFAGLYMPHEIVAKGYAPATRAEKKTFTLPDFCTREDYRLLPLEIKIMYADKAIGVNGTEEMIHPLRTPR